MTARTGPPGTRHGCMGLPRARWPPAVGGRLRLLALGPLLEDPLGFFQLAFAGRGQILARAIDEVLDHPDPRPDPLRTDLFSGHRPGDGLGIPGEGVARWDGRTVLTPATPRLLLPFECFFVLVVRAVMAESSLLLTAITDLRGPAVSSSAA